MFLFLFSLLGENGTGTLPWCHVAYWELRRRVGRLYSVFDSSINVFHRLPHPPSEGGLCLAVLHEHNVLAISESSRTNENNHSRCKHTKHMHPGHLGRTRNRTRIGEGNNNEDDSVRRTCEKIGLGLSLSQEVDGIWVYNRSKHPIFVNTPMLDNYLPSQRTFSVIKVPPGYSMKIFDYSIRIERTRDSDLLDGPYDPNSIRISFAKGWGPNYSRQFITSCPCWIEVLLSVNR